MSGLFNFFWSTSVTPGTPFWLNNTQGQPAQNAPEAQPEDLDAVDWRGSLPSDIWGEIFHRLADRKMDLIRCAATCREFRQLLNSSLPGIWGPVHVTLDLGMLSLKKKEERKGGRWGGGRNFDPDWDEEDEEDEWGFGGDDMWGDEGPMRRPPPLFELSSTADPDGAVTTTITVSAGEKDAALAATRRIAAFLAPKLQSGAIPSLTLSLIVEDSTYSDDENAKMLQSRAPVAKEICLALLGPVLESAAKAERPPPISIKGYASASIEGAKVAVGLVKSAYESYPTLAASSLYVGAPRSLISLRETKRNRNTPAILSKLASYLDVIDSIPRTCHVNLSNLPNIHQWIVPRLVPILPTFQAAEWNMYDDWYNDAKQSAFNEIKLDAEVPPALTHVTLYAESATAVAAHPLLRALYVARKLHSVTTLVVNMPFFRSLFSVDELDVFAAAASALPELRRLDIGLGVNPPDFPRWERPWAWMTFRREAAGGPLTLQFDPNIHQDPAAPYKIDAPVQRILDAVPDRILEFRLYSPEFDLTTVMDTQRFGFPLHPPYPSTLAVEAVKGALERGLSANPKLPSRRSLLHTLPEHFTPGSFRRGNFQEDCDRLLQLLLSHGADLFATTPDGDNVLHCAEKSPYWREAFLKACPTEEDKNRLLDQCNAKGKAPRYIALPTPKPAAQREEPGFGSGGGFNFQNLFFGR